MRDQSSNTKKACNSSPNRCYHRYLKPGALAKLRDSKITSKHTITSRTQHIALSQLLLPLASPSSPTQQEQPLNEDNGIPCFDSTVNLLINRPRCLTRKKLFAVTPFFTHSTDTYNF
ncbi:hypothetical protein SESBI_42584 [Sesbania bispinosa]|nr:hypothetical protein SESBI_42584 [Sesbania bispinosa]